MVPSLRPIYRVDSADEFHKQMIPENAALIDPSHVRGMVTIEPGGSCTTANPLSVLLTQDQITKLAAIPTLVLYGDHLSGGFLESYADCHDVHLPQIAAGDITFVSLPDMGIHDSSHMMMLDKNNLEIADIVMAWIDAHGPLTETSLCV